MNCKLIGKHQLVRFLIKEGKILDSEVLNTVWGTDSTYAASDAPYNMNICRGVKND